MEEKDCLNDLIRKKLLEIRNLNNLTQTDMSNLLNLNLSTYKHYELGDRAISIELFINICDKLKIDPEYFINEMEDNDSKDKLLKSLKLMLGQVKSQQDKNFIPMDFREEYNKNDKYINIVAKRLKALRVKNKKTQKDVADYLQVDNSTYNKYENGNRKVPLFVVRELSKYYAVNFKELVE